MNAFDLSNQRIAITGAAGGIGQATAKLVARLGADVMLSDLESPKPLADYIAESGRTATAVSLDITNREEVDTWA